MFQIPGFMNFPRGNSMTAKNILLTETLFTLAQRRKFLSMTVCIGQTITLTLTGIPYLPKAKGRYNY